MNTYRDKRGFTFVEVCMCILILSLVFGCAFYVMNYARKETQKGYWIQQTIEMLRNSTKQIGIKLKEKNYPSTLYYKKKGVDEEGKPKYDIKVISYKEWREYDRSGRLRNIEINEKGKNGKSYEIYMNKTTYKPTNQPQELMYFPICTPEKEIDGETTEGVGIVMHRFVLEPTENFEITKLGRIFMEQYTVDPIDTKQLYKVSPRSKEYCEERRAYALIDLEPHKYFGNMNGSKNFKRKEICTDVYEVQLDSKDLSLEGGKGVAVSTGGTITPAPLINNIIIFKITCKNPKDDKVKLSDMCVITTNSEVDSL